MVHYGVKCYIDMVRPKAAKKLLNCREIRKIDMEQFRQDILSSSVVIHPQADPDALVNQYMSDLRGILDQHAPEKERKITLLMLMLRGIAMISEMPSGKSADVNENGKSPN